MKKNVELCNAKKCQREKINVLFVFHRSSYKWNSLIALCNSPLFIRPNQISVKNNAESEENTGIVDFCLGFSILNQFSCCNSAIDRLCNRLNDRCETEHTMEIDLDGLNRKTKFLNFFPTEEYMQWNYVKFEFAKPQNIQIKRKKRRKAIEFVQLSKTNLKERKIM